MHLAAHRARYVTACQQLLALAAVLAVLTPAANVVNLDMVTRPPADGGSGPAAGLVAATTRGESADVPVGTVHSSVREVPLSQGATLARGGDGARTLTSSPAEVEGTGTIGVTWSHDQPLDDAVTRFTVRTQTDGRWSDWQDMPFHDEHAPDPGSVEAERTRGGTDAVYVGAVDQVQVRVSVTGALPDDLSLAIVDPGTPRVTARQAPTAAPSGRSEAANAPVVTGRPRIFSRAQWGADERLRDKGSLRYYEVHGGFVHHTVSVNGYSRDQVPGILRGIYAYHTRSLGWSDIGYNYLVDRFGRIWEGRYGGIDRPVVGAHTLGYNDYSFAMSAIGNYDVTRPSDRMINAYGRLFAWKLSLHGVRADSSRQVIAGKSFPAINGHRDAGSTACPGRYLYARLPDIRSKAAQLQATWAGRQRFTSLVDGTDASIVARRARDGAGVVIPIVDGSPQRRVGTGASFTSAVKILSVGDWDRDGHGDVVTLTRSGALQLYRGDGTGKLAAPRTLASGFDKAGLLTAAGDMTGDGYPDLMGQLPGGSMMIWPGAGDQGLGKGYAAHSRISANRHFGVGLMDGDGAPDSLVRRGGKLVLYPGNGPGGLESPTRTYGRPMGGYDWVLGVGDANGNGRADIITRDRETKALYRLGTTADGLQKRVLIGNGKAYDLAG